MLIANLFNSKYLAKVFEVAAVIAIYSGLFNMVFKFVFNRERPSIGSGNPFHFFQFILSKDHQLIDLTYACNSMPSGHTITIASSLTVLFLSFKNKLIKSICIFFMLIIPLSRVYTINHWFSDIFTSFVIGSIFGYIIYDIHLSNNEIIF
jgi:membrane-associated phospholipid phosphatase